LGTLSTDGAETVPTTVEVGAAEDLPFALSAELSLRGGPEAARESARGSDGAPSILRADLLGLLARGRLRVHAFDHVRELGDVHVVLVAEQLARLALEAARGLSQGRALFKKVFVGGALVGVRGSTNAVGQRKIALTLGSTPSRGEHWTFPSLDVSTFARAVVDFGRGLARALVRSDRSQAHNLRLVELRATLRELGDLARETPPTDAVVNDCPESYRAYARDSEERRPPSPTVGRLRFVPKWTAAVPSIDLRSTFLCGESLLVGALRELSAIDRTSGAILWTKPVSKGVSVLTPAGLARFDSDGELSLHDLATGEVKRTLELAPRVGAPVTGAVISGPGLPRMLVISEGKRDLSCVDLDAGEVLWRFSSRRAGTFRLKRAGRLVVVSSGEQTLTAIDALSGEVVWRYCDELRFNQTAAVADDGLFAVAGDGAHVATGAARLCHLNPWSGEHRWSVSLPEGTRSIGAPLVSQHSVVVALLGRRGTELQAFDRRTGEKLFEREGPAGIASPLLLDDVVTLNGENGELAAFDAQTGALRFRHVFVTGAEGDRPRRMDPVLRGGALFVPQGSIHVMRPRDGALLGTVPVDLVPDLLRVDERCDVYVAEESGHLAAFSAGARLTLVKAG
jgi:outer membrane protein assembly factor BamB